MDWRASPKRVKRALYDKARVMVLLRDSKIRESHYARQRYADRINSRDNGSSPTHDLDWRPAAVGVAAVRHAASLRIHHRGAPVAAARPGSRLCASGRAGNPHLRPGCVGDMDAQVEVVRLDRARLVPCLRILGHEALAQLLHGRRTARDLALLARVGAAAHGGELPLRELAKLLDRQGIESAEARLPPFAGRRPVLERCSAAIWMRLARRSG